MLPLEIAGLVVFAAIKVLSNIGGIGGGGVSIPIVMAMFYFSSKPAIAISSFAIFITTIARFVLNFRERHPDKPNSVVIDYDLVSIMMPTTLAGAQIGALILVITPDLLIQVLLTLVLIVLTVQSVFKAIEVTRKENLAAKSEQNQETAQVNGINESTTEQKLLASYAGSDAGTSSNVTLSTAASGSLIMSPVKRTRVKKDDDFQKVSASEVVTSTKPYFDPVLNVTVKAHWDKDQVDACRDLVKSEQSHGQWLKQSICIILLLLLILMNLCMGSSSKESIIGLKVCGTGYWLIQFGFIVACFFATITAVKRAQYDQSLKLSFGGVNVADSDVRFDSATRVRQLLVLGFFGGWIAGALGLGGGCIYTPVLMSMGVPPKVSAATGLYLVMFSKIASVLIYFLNGQLYVWYGLWIAGWATLALLFSLCAVESYIQNSGRQSIIVWALVTIFIVSVIAIPTFAGFSLKEDAEEGLDLMAFTSLCEASPH